MTPESTDCKVVILAGGYGTRLAERTDDIPKPMVEIGSRPILWHILSIYSAFGFNDFLIACGYRGDVIKRFFLEYRDRSSDLLIDFARDRVEHLSEPLEPWRVALIDTGEGTETGGRLLRLREHIGNQTFLLTYGDGVGDIPIPDLLAFHRDHGRLATFTAVHPPARFGHPQLVGDQAVGFVEKPDESDEWISAGFFVLEPDVLDYIAGNDTKFEVEPLARLARDGELMAYRHEGFWHPMDTLRDVRNLNRMWAEGNAPWSVWTQCPKNNRQSTGPVAMFS